MARESSEKDLLSKVEVGVSGMTPDVRVVNPDPNYVYRLVGKDKVAYNQAKGYEGIDKETVIGPLSVNQGKEHGDAVLMRCPRGIVEARNKMREDMANSRVARMTENVKRGPGRVGGRVSVIRH